MPTVRLAYMGPTGRGGPFWYEETEPTSSACQRKRQIDGMSVSPRGKDRFRARSFDLLQETGLIKPRQNVMPSIGRTA